VSGWQQGSRWEHRRTDGPGIAAVAGTVLESEPPRRLTITFGDPGGKPRQGTSRVIFDIEPFHEIVRLTVTHEDLPDDDARKAVSAGWPAVCANLTSLLDRPRAAACTVGNARRVCQGGSVPAVTHQAKAAISRCCRAGLK
jgi:uncharacterized protein YndB with AHSA1/START domain